MDSSQKNQAEQKDLSTPFDVSPDRLNQMSLTELREEMEQALDSMTEETYSATVIDAYLEAMDHKSPISTLPPSAEDAYNILYSKLSQEFRDENPIDAQQIHPGQGMRTLRMGLVAVIAAVCLLGSMVVAQAAGIDVFGGLARWTDDIFSFGAIYSESAAHTTTGAAQQANSAEFSENLPIEYQDLWMELETKGISCFLFPIYIPDGFQFDDSSLIIFPESNTVDFTAWYVNESDQIAFGILSSNNIHSTYEKSQKDVEVYEVNGIDHYIFTNVGENVVVWCVGDLEYSLTSTLPVFELKTVIDAMYQE